MPTDRRLETIPAATLEVQVIDRLRDAILDRRFPPGSQLNQVQIAAQFGTSRGPVRLALHKLEEEGLVRNIPHRGAIVTPLDRKAVRDLYGVRAALEAYGVRTAVPHSTEADAERLTTLVSRMREAAGRGDAAEVIHADFLFHRFFIELAGNALLLRAWSTCRTQVQRVLSFRHRSHPDLQEIADSHLPFLPLMRAKDARRAAELMESHIHEACEDLMARGAFPGKGEDAASKESSPSPGGLPDLRERPPGGGAGDARAVLRNLRFVTGKGGVSCCEECSS